MKRISNIEEIGQLLRLKREEQGLNQKEFAEAAGGVGNRIVSEVERGKPTAQVDKVLKLLKYAGLSIYVGDE